MNRCQRRVLLAFGVSMAALWALGIASALAASPTGLAVGILIAVGLISTGMAVLFAIQWNNCT